MGGVDLFGTMILGMFDRLAENTFFSGGLFLMAIGSLGAFLRHLPGKLCAFVERRLSISVEVLDRDPAFRWLTDWLEDLRDFQQSAAWYAQRGIPYRRGYLLHGPPGTGKTTTVLALAGELKLSLAVLSLSNRLMGDESLLATVNALPAATILLIEDVDCVFKNPRTTESNVGVTLSGLLNALDGVSSRDGRILFMTTNHPERLDPALLRPGRVDRKIELGFATFDQARRLYLWFYQGCGLTDSQLSAEADRFANQVSPGRVCMAALQEHLLRHRRSPEAAAREVVFDEGCGDRSEFPEIPRASRGHFCRRSGCLVPVNEFPRRLYRRSGFPA